MNAGQVALVSGGSRGLGAALVQALLAAGWRVATFSRQSTPSIERCGEQHAGSFDWQPLDAADFDALRGWVAHVRDRWDRIDALVNNSAVSREGRLTLQSTDDIHTLLAVNLESVIHLSRAAAQTMLNQRHGAIVNISSVNALRGHTGVAVYSATKAALDGLTRSLARELGPSGIRVNSVAPGYFASALTAGMPEEQRKQIVRRTPLGRLAEAEDIAGVVRFLLSDEARFVTGQTLVVDGGLTC
ncbi:MAG TPA: SDR family oxidoreductase [Pirellulales bacterium]